MLRRIASVLALGCIALSAVTPTNAATPVIAPKPATGTDEAILRQILADWKARHERFQSVSYTLEGEAFRPKGMFNDLREELKPKPSSDIPPVSITYSTSAEIDVSFAVGGVRCRRKSVQYGPDIKVHLTTQTYVFDGTQHSRYTPRSENEWYDLERNALPELENNERGVIDRFFDDPLRPLFYGHGIVMKRGNAGQLLDGSDPETMRIHGREQLDGRDCVVLRTIPRGAGKAFYEYWVDIERDSAIVRYSRSAGGRENQIAVVEYRQTPDGWLPRKWKHESFIPDGSLYQSETLRVEEIVRNPALPIERFRIAPAPGMILWSKGKYIFYRGKDLPPLDAKEELRKEKKRSV